MAFDPDAYLAKKAGPGASFDPDAYLASKKATAPEAHPDDAAVSKLESILRGAAQGASLNFSDEITGGLESLLTPKTYDQAVGEARANNAAAEQANPMSYVGGQFGGGVATSLIPGLGGGNIAKAVGAGSKMLEAGKLGALLGAAGNVGASEDKSVGDAAKGAVTGGLFGAGMQGATMLGSKAIGALGRKLSDGVNPDAQLGLAVGATAKELNPSIPAGKDLRSSVNLLDKAKLFEIEPGKTLDLDTLAHRVDAFKRNIGEQIGKRVESYGDAVLPHDQFYELISGLRNKLDDIVASAPGESRASAAAALDHDLNDLFNTGGNIADIWALKSRSGGWASKAYAQAGQPPPIKEGHMALNSALDDVLTGEMDTLFRKTGDRGLADLNASYKAAKTVEPLLGRAIGKEAAAPSSLGFSPRDLGAGGSVAAVLSGMGVPAPVAAPLGLLGAGANQYARSVQGRVQRAQVGRSLEAAQQKISVMTGAIPRNVKGAQDWLKRNITTLPPEMQGTANAIIGAPSDRAEQMLRGVIPTFAEHFAKSSYPSELEGKVSTDDDKMAIRRKLQTMQLPATQMALKLSALNRDGTIPAEVYNPDDYQDEMMQFANKMMGSM